MSNTTHLAPVSPIPITGLFRKKRDLLPPNREYVKVNNNSDALLNVTPITMHKKFLWNPLVFGKESR